MSEMIKVCLAGDSNVGKTSIVKNFLGDPTAYKNSKPTVAVEANPTIDMQSTDGRLFSLTIWDTSGQEQYRTLVPMYFRDASVVIIVVANDDMNTFQSIGEWQDTIFQANTKCKLIFVVNKCDLDPAPGVTDDFISDQGRSIAALEIFKTSAITGEGVKDLFQYIVDSDDIEPDQNYLNGLTDEDKKQFVDGSNTINSSKGCC